MIIFKMFGNNSVHDVLMVSFLTYLINIPFGYWRANLKKFSKKWFLAVHLPVPLIVLFRITFGVHINLPTFIVFVISFFLGQRTGILINKWLNRTRAEKTS